MSINFIAQINPIAGRKSFNSGRTGIGGNSTGVMMDSIPNTEPGPPELAWSYLFCAAGAAFHAYLREQLSGTDVMVRACLSASHGFQRE